MSGSVGDGRPNLGAHLTARNAVTGDGGIGDWPLRRYPADAARTTRANYIGTRAATTAAPKSTPLCHEEPRQSLGPYGSVTGAEKSTACD